jgi:hypothetical protein
MLRAVDQVAQHLRDLLCRQSQSPTSQALRQLVKGCQLAIQSARILVDENKRLHAILADENKRLHALNHRAKRKADQRSQYIHRREALQVQQGQELVVEADRVVEGDPGHPEERRPRAPPTCTICHVQGHRRTQCTQR